MPLQDERFSGMVTQVEQPKIFSLNLGDIALKSEGWEQIEEKVREALPPHWSEAERAHGLGDAALQLGQNRKAIEFYREAIRLFPDDIAGHENLIFLLDAQAETTDESAAADRMKWWNQFGRERYEQRVPHRNLLHPHKRLRVGYVSGDFRFHSASFGFGHIIRSHTSRIEPVYYSTLNTAAYDTTTKNQWVEKVGGSWVDISTLSAAECARVIQEDGIDILVDLAGYTSGNRLLAFTHKPAPIQITAWGYATGVGWPAMDVLFSDAIVSENYPGPERIVNLPSVISFNPRPDLPEVNELPCLTKGPVFGVFQRAMKMTRPVLETYAEILRRVPTASIVFKAGDYLGLAKAFIAECMPGVLARIQFLPSTSNRDHSMFYQHIDLSLDPWPQTGGISTLEAMHMGVPTVTLIGPRIIQRASASFLTTVGLPNFIAQTREDYIDKAVYYVTEGRPVLSKIRASLRERLRGSAIITGYVEEVEDAYFTLWQEHCAKHSQQEVA